MVLGRRREPDDEQVDAQEQAQVEDVPPDTAVLVEPKQAEEVCSARCPHLPTADLTNAARARTLWQQRHAWTDGGVRVRWLRARLALLHWTTALVPQELIMLNLHKSACLCEHMHSDLPKHHGVRTCTHTMHNHHAAWQVARRCCWHGAWAGA